MSLKILREILAYEARFLTFRRAKPDLANHGRYYLAFGLFFTWLVGVGRYWDNPRAELWQYLGLGSVAYVFVLALVIFLLLWPLRPRNWSYRNVLIFIMLTSPMALLYAIPVERFMSLGHAQAANVGFLALVALWRVALYIHFLRTAAGMNWIKTIVAALLPLALIVVALALMNLEHVVFDLMAGIRDENRGPNDISYMVVLSLGVFSFIASPVLILAYAVLVIWEVFKGRRARQALAP